MPWRRSICSAAVVVTLGAIALGTSRASAPAYKIVVNQANASAALDRKFLTEAFLKRTTRWPGGETIRPVDQGSDSAVRRRFSEDVLKRSVAAVKSYWQQMIFSGRAIPPPELEGDEEVLRFVSRHAGGIGYVSSGGELPGVKVVTLK